MPTDHLQTAPSGAIRPDPGTPAAGDRQVAAGRTAAVPVRRTWRPASSAPARPRVSRAERFADGPRQALALSFAAAFVVCVAVEPEPTGPHADHLELWLLPVELLALTSIVAAVVLLMRGSSRAHPAGIAAGVLMCVGTALCPGLGHHVMGSFVWVQAGASLLVLLGSAALPRLGLPGRTPRT